MKSKKQFITLLLMYAVMLLIVVPMMKNKQQAKPPSPVALMTQAQKEVDARNYGAALQTYQQIGQIYGGSKSELDKNAAAQAELAIADLNEQHVSYEATRFFVSKYTATGTDQTALDTLKTLEQKYPDQTIEVGKAGDAQRVKAGEYARSRYKALSYKVDKENSKNPLYQVMDLLVRATGKNPAFSYTLALLVLTLLIKVITTPLTKKQFKSMIDMQRLQPKLKELQDKYKDKPDELNRKMMSFYKEHGVNPLGGCLPLLIQMPVMMGLYYMIRLYQFQFADASFLWIKSLAQPDLPLLILYAISMYFSTKITAMPTADPAQAQQQKIMGIAMPVMFSVFLRQLPSAFVLYWFCFNVVSTWQQYHIMKHLHSQPGPGEGGTPGGNGKIDKAPAKSQGIKPRRRSAKAL